MSYSVPAELGIELFNRKLCMLGARPVYHDGINQLEKIGVSLGTSIRATESP